MDVSEARELARDLLADDSPRRWDHVRGVAARAELFAGTHRQADLLISAAYLHDVGYAAPSVDSGFHQIDGARFLRARGCDEAVVNLVAHHSGAANLMRLAGLGETLAHEFPQLEPLPHRELHFCDLTVDPHGRSVTIDQRLADIRVRHKANPVMLQFLSDHEHDLQHMVGSFWHQLGSANSFGHDAMTDTVSGPQIAAAFD